MALRETGTRLAEGGRRLVSNAERGRPVRPKRMSESDQLKRQRADEPSALLLAYYGDDFTGSTDVMEALSRAGLRTVLFLKPPTKAQLAKFPGLRAFGIAGGSRTMSPEEMETELPPAFEALKAARKAGLKVGALHRFDPCQRADAQSANFVTMVPRDPALLPPAIAFEEVADHCTTKVSDAAVESELLTFVNQVEMHAGRPVILKLSAAAEDRYAMGARIERDLWLVRDRFLPRYAGRPWLLWSANRARITEAAEEPLEWVVVQP